MDNRIRIVHYLNQFFAQIGGEEQAGVGPGVKDGAVGPGRALQEALGDRGEIIATVFCGDNYFAENQQVATEELLQRVAAVSPALVIAGPAFGSGRYGVACGAVCQAVQQQLGISAVTAMDEENPGADLYRKTVYIVSSGASVTQMTSVLQRMAALGVKLAQGLPVGKPEEEGYIPRGIKRNEFAAKPPAERALDMLLAKIHGQAFKSEIPAPKFSAGKPAAPIRDLSAAVIALVTDGGLVPEGNPQRMEPGRPTRFAAIPIEGVSCLDAAAYDVVHSGYDTMYVNQDPHRLVPLDVMRELEQRGAFGRLYEVIHTTGGAHAAVEKAVQIGQGIAKRLKAAGVNGVILTST